MFIGHFGVAFALKRAAPEVKLGTAMLAATLLDLLWPVFVAVGLEIVKISPGATEFTPLRFVSYPFSHSLTATLLWGLLFAWVYALRGGSRRGAVWLGMIVISHWFLDLIVHEADLQIVTEIDVYVGLGLWHSTIGTLIVEGALFAVGLALYLSATRARDRAGSWGLWALVALLLVSYVAAAFGPPPPNVAALVIAGLVGGGITVVWAYWVDRHRAPV